jgi:hypothetical protein
MMYTKNWKIRRRRRRFALRCENGTKTVLYKHAHTGIIIISYTYTFQTYVTHNYNTDVRRVRECSFFIHFTFYCRGGRRTDYAVQCKYTAVSSLLLLLPLRPQFTYISITSRGPGCVRRRGNGVLLRAYVRERVREIVILSVREGGGWFYHSTREGLMEVQEFSKLFFKSI